MIRQALVVIGLMLLAGLAGASAVQHEIGSFTYSLTQFLER